MSGRKQLKLSGIFDSQITDRGYVLSSQVGETVLPATSGQQVVIAPATFPFPGTCFGNAHVGPDSQYVQSLCLARFDQGQHAPESV